ncbi:MAG: chromosomal replication initiator protein DnaA [Spartobacteria bacterium]|nr:chromosomal replication initiator protein DnaA [Spartobacteria bacterium]
MSQQKHGLVWSKARKHLATVLSKDVYERWIGLIESKEMTEDTLTLCVSNDFYQSWLEENYLSLIEDAVTAVCGNKLTIMFAVSHMAPPTQKNTELNAEDMPTDGTAKKASPVARKTSGAKRTQRTLNTIPLNNKYTFDSFVVGPSNHFSHAASLAVAQSPAKAYNPLFIYGCSGLGKTHLMQAIGHVVQQNTNASISYLSSEQFVNEYIDALQKGGLVGFRKKYRNTDLLLIDDIHFLAGKERMQEEFFHTFNTLFDNHKQIVLTSDRPASEIAGLEHRLVSRFEWGLVTELEAPDIETRIAILRKKREELKLSLSDDVLVYIAEHIRSNIRRLEGALIRATSYTSLTGRALSLANLESLLRDTLDQERQEALTIEQIQRTVADYYDIRLADMTSNRRPQSIAFPRQVAMYLCRNMTNYSLPAIGEAFARNHATVMHACKLVTTRINKDAEFRHNLSVLNQKLTQRR